jgi:TRAP-type C4-dicarboxylate transport system permease small subunit
LFSRLTGFFETEQVEPGIYDNICEASNFYPMWPLAVLTMVVARWRLRMRISPLLGALAVYLICLSLYCVVPMPGWLLRGTLLSFATEQRALLGIGLVNILLCCLFLDRYRARVFTSAGAVIAGLVLWLMIAFLLQAIRSHDTAFSFDAFQVVLALVINGVILTLFFWENMRRWLPLFSARCSFSVTRES